MTPEWSWVCRGDCWFYIGPCTAYFRPVNSGVDALSYNRDFEISVTFLGYVLNPLVVSQTTSVASHVKPRSVVHNKPPRVVPLSDDDMFVHPVLRRTSPCRIFTQAVNNGIRRGPDPVTVEADRLIAKFLARREARAQRSNKMIEKFSESGDEDEKEMTIPNALWYSTDVVVLVLGHVLTPFV
ncbi:hypothetical protein TanjilG_29385 [Lupinus angustifolius]|uniref:Uncharacterized protein n=1 Tax=Lupinus angustifolius TaxID=3871 RepID=A0A1J7GEX6_LUPAN|nr:hypothetical protein TanjilG_29385 [Lupinus angustifolius]